MLDKIALFLCLAFILYALRKDLKEFHQVTKSIWIPFVWVALSATKSITRWVYPSRNVAWQERAPGWDPMQGDAFERTFLIILMVIALAILVRRFKRFSLDLKANGWLLALVLYCLMSMSWSDYPGIAIKRWVRIVGDILMVLLILTEDDPEEASDHILRWCAIVLIPLSVVFIKYYRYLGVVYFRYGLPMYVGVTGHKNQLGALCAFLGLYLLWRHLKNYPKFDYLDTALFLLTFYLLFISNSKTSFIIFILGTVVLVLKRLTKGDIRKFQTMILVPLMLLLVFQVFLVTFLNQSAEAYFLSTVGRDSTLTGRTPLWRTLIGIGSQKPLLGAGYGSFWVSREAFSVWRVFQWMPTTAHNAYIDIFLDLGIIGLILVVVFLIHGYQRCFRHLKNKAPMGDLKFVFFIMIVLQSFTESPILKANSFSWILLLLLSTSIIAKQGAQDAST